MCAISSDHGNDQVVSIMDLPQSGLSEGQEKSPTHEEKPTGKVVKQHILEHTNEFRFYLPVTEVCTSSLNSISSSFDLHPDRPPFFIMKQ